MQNFAPGSAASVTFQLLNEAGEVLAPTGLRYRVTDEADTVLLDWTTTAYTSGPTAVVTVIGALNILTPPAVRGLRVIDLEITTADGVFYASESVMIAATSQLVFGVNSSQTYNQALLAAEDFAETSLSGWFGASREAREKALIEAHNRILMLPLGLLFDDTQAMMIADEEFIFGYGIGMLWRLKPEQWPSIDRFFMAAIRSAQLVEADDILAGDVLMVAGRTRTVLSERVGESSTSYNSVKPMNFPVGPRALAYLSRYVRFGASAARR